MIKSNAILQINKKNIIYNYKLLSKIAKKSICAATIKANAYGLGDLEICKILHKEGCNHFFLATTEEAINIRKGNKNIILYVLNGLEDNNINLFIKYNLIPILNSTKEIITAVNKKRLNKNLKFGIHVETGLNRLGVNLDDFKKNLLKNINVEILISHLSSANELKNNYSKLQNLKFIKSFSEFKDIKYKSLCSSAGIFNNKNLHHEMVRPGISLYGGYEYISKIIKTKIKPVIFLKGKILQIKEIKENEFIGYNQTYKTNAKIKIAIIGIGYADGISRSLGNNGKLYFKKDIYKIIGRVSMDSVTVDISMSKYKIKIGQYMDVINNDFTIELMARKCGTISNEILTAISKRVERQYI